MRTYLFVLLLALGGCATQRPQLTREQWLEITARAYPERSPAQVLSAAEKLFRLADGDDFKIVHSPEGLAASRSWVAYFIIGGANGTDYWTVKAVPEGTGTMVTVAASTQSETIAPMIIGGVGAVPTSLGMPGVQIDGTALYDVFWARLEYLLGLRPEWMTCEEADGRVKANTTWGNNEPLCNSFNMTDDKPTGPIFPPGR